MGWFRKFCAGLRGAAVGVVALLPATGGATAQTLALLTEENPPYNFTDPATGRLIGLATEIVEETMRRAGVAYTMERMPWQRAYHFALTQPNTCLFATNETDERRPHFHWVGPITRGGWALFARAGSEIAIRSLDDVRGLRIGGHAGTSWTDKLVALGHPVECVRDHALVPLMLQAGRIDLWAGGRHAAPFQAKLAGIRPPRMVYVHQESVLSLACQKTTPDGLIERLRSALSEAHADGAAAEIIARYQ